MHDTVATIRSYFLRLGLTTEIADLYVALQTDGPQSISELSRTSKVERTRIYRLLDQLRSSGLIEEETKYKRSILKAAPIANLRILIDQKQQELEKLHTELKGIQQVLAANTETSPTTHVQYYQGTQGLRQILWNELRSTTEIIAYSYQIFDEGVGRPFMTNWVEEFEHRGLHKKVLFNEPYVTSWHDRPGSRIKGMEYNYINPKILTVSHTCNVYNNVTSYLNWRDGELFGVEIYNQEIADVHRQVLGLIWAKSQPKHDSKLSHHVAGQTGTFELELKETGSLRPRITD